MRPQRRHLCLESAVSIAVIALLGGISGRARAEEAPAAEPPDVALAERKAAEAFQAYTRKDYAAAVALYLDAYAATPSGSILYNVARIYDTKLVDRPLAISFYRRYIADPGASTDLIEAANRRLVELRDAELAASSPTGEGAASGGYKERGGGGSPRIDRDTVQERRGGWSTQRWVGVALGAVGLVGAGVGGGFGLAAMSNAHTANDSCDGNACTSQGGVDAAHAARRDATISTIGFGAGSALLLTGAALFFLGAERPSAQSSYAAVHLETAPTTTGVSLRVSGRW
jgi:hypothetical protein